MPIHMIGERFCGTQKEDECVPVNIQYTLGMQPASLVSRWVALNSLYPNPTIFSKEVINFRLVLTALNTFFLVTLYGAYILFFRLRKKSIKERYSFSFLKGWPHRMPIMQRFRCFNRTTTCRMFLFNYNILGGQ
jgi:hypothetical protein